MNKFVVFSISYIIDFEFKCVPYILTTFVENQTLSYIHLAVMEAFKKKNIIDF